MTDPLAPDPREGPLRRASLARHTRETQIDGSLLIEGTGQAEIVTGMPFFDHLLDQVCRHGLLDLSLRAEGDLAVDWHHTVEDTGLLLGSLLDAALGDRAGINRYGFFYAPLDEALARVVIDLSGRPFLVYDLPADRGERVRDFDLDLLEDFFQALTQKGRFTMHLHLLSGRNSHHKAEAVFKAFARALRVAVARDPRQSGVPSTKGTL
ncbi:MAG: imidazoleglycerol-phosphate dehydratase HisB [Nitrospirae bacterium]|nr:imidazoleglycerol-phosphate dehydratase HisB [Nitrospirota bacterium]MCL5285239.1 imidazoleglycerol-phosphate dehydratase HisB [Nitrospirota bacterium]